MTRRVQISLAVAALFTLVNLGGAVYAGRRGELLHCGVHVALFLLGVCGVWWLLPSSQARRARRRGERATADSSDNAPDRLSRIEQSVDAVAIEVERIGEGQRFMTRVLTEKAIPKAPGARVADPNES